MYCEFLAGTYYKCLYAVYWKPCIMNKIWIACCAWAAIDDCARTCTPSVQTIATVIDNTLTCKTPSL